MESPTWEVVVRCYAVKKLSTRLVSSLGGSQGLSVRVQATLAGAQRETGPSTWGARGTPRSGDAVWNSRDGALAWGPFDSHDNARDAVAKKMLKLHVYASSGEPTLDNSSPLGALTIDFGRDAEGTRQPSWAKLGGAGAPAELLYSAALRRVSRPAPELLPASPTRSIRASIDAPSPTETLPAKQIGRGSTTFELCLSLERAGELHALVGRELEEAALREGGRSYWFSLEMLGVVLQTPQFDSGQLQSPDFAAQADWFRLRCSVREVAAELSKPISVYLCTSGLVVAAGTLNLEAILPQDAWPRDRSDGEFYASEQRHRIRIDSRRALFAPPTEPGWLDVCSKLRRIGCSERDAVDKRGPRGYTEPTGQSPLEPTAPPTPQRAQAPAQDDADSYADESFDGDEDEEDGDDGDDAPPVEAPPPPPDDGSADVVRRWRLHVDLLEAKFEAKFSEQQAARRVRFQFKGPEALGQPAKTFATADFDVAGSVGLGGDGAIFEFGRSVHDLRKNVLGVLTVELVSADGGAILGAAQIDLNDAGLFAASAARFDDDGSRQRVREADYGILILDEEDDDSAKAASTLRARITLDELNYNEASWGEGVASRLLQADDSKCSACGALVAEAASRWEAWRAEEERAWASRLRLREKAKMAKLEAEAEKAREAERGELAAHRAEYARLEAKLRASLRDVEARERALTDADAALKRERQAKVAELQMLEKRLRDEARHLIEAEKRKALAMEKLLKKQRLETEKAEKRCVAVDADFDRWRSAHRRTPEAELVARVAKARAESAELRTRVERAMRETAEANAERERLRAHVHRLAKALQTAKDEAHDKARRDLDELRLEYRGREEKFVLDGDRRELRNIKDELEGLRKLAVDPRQVRVFNPEPVAPPPPQYDVRVEAQASRVEAHGARPRRQRPANSGDAYEDSPPTYASSDEFYAGDEPPPPPSPPPHRARRANSPRVDDDVLRAINSNRDYRGGAPRGACEAHDGGAPRGAREAHDRLVLERRVLVDDAGYPEDDALVLELDRLIRAADAAE
ncbi:hypothetical protein M885DRAFT_456030 [Pelagophyceae sp. CCMP2097]|nr:hypothetical protein M885DRAFT_456030 [Pelagophyceae sp. CCMP2097]